MATFDAIHGTTNIARFLGITRSEAKGLIETGALRTYQVADRTCASAEEIHRHAHVRSGLDAWENEGGSHG